MRSAYRARTAFLTCTALGSALLLPSVVMAQDADAEGGLAEIIVTAQKREQSVQDVPIAVTALSEDALQANRITTVNDLSGLAPGMTVRPTAGGQQIPSFSVRGAVSTGVVPGSDKQVSLYLDGVYLGSSRGSIFDLPDVVRIEMLRGPQGTLFGRNATAGAISISTREPTGEPSVRAEYTIGNHNQKRYRLSAEMPQIGPFSGYFSFLHTYRRGDFRNLGAGQVWDRTLSPEGDIRTSPKWLGTRDSDSYFAALKFAPSDDFTTTYKYDRNESNNTPEGTGLVAYDKFAGGGLLGGFIDALITSQPNASQLLAPSGKRPKAVANSWATHVDQKSEGHSLTSNLRISDSVSLKNIFAYRKSSIFSPSAIDGVAGLPLTAQAADAYATFAAFSAYPTNPTAAMAAIPVIRGQLQYILGSPVVLFASAANGVSEQYSDELQLNYDSDFLTLTAGALWFKSKDKAGSLAGMQNTFQFVPIPFGIVPLGNQGISYNSAKSIAAYTQAEFHVAPGLDLIGGARWTKDKKWGRFEFGTPGAITVRPFDYKKSKPTFLLGVNYKPSDDTLLYAKYSTAFVSGGSVVGIEFGPETAKSWEAGIKTDMFNRRLRTNLSLFHVKYEGYQTSQSPQSFTALGLIPEGADPAIFPYLGTFVYPGGDLKAYGFELETTVLVASGLTAGGSLSYTKTKNTNQPQVLFDSGQQILTQRPKWTGGLWASYESEPFAGDARFSLRLDGTWRSKYRVDGVISRPTALYDKVTYSPSNWMVNGRAAIKDIPLGPVKGEIGLWGRNLLNEDHLNYSLIFGGINASANYEQSRTYGIDFIVQF